MPDIKSTLKDIGLTDTETEIYLAGLPYLSTGVRELENGTRIKRTTIYHALGTLMTKGLVGKKTTRGKTAYTMTRPEHLTRAVEKNIVRLETQRDALRTIVPLLAERRPGAKEGIAVMSYEGHEGVRAIMEEALYCRSRHWDIIAPVKNYLSICERTYRKYVMKTRGEREITTRALWEYSPNWKPLSGEEIKRRQPRFLPKEFTGKFQSLIILFDDKVALIPLAGESAALVQSPELHSTMLVLFEGLWNSAMPYS